MFCKHFTLHKPHRWALLIFWDFYKNKNIDEFENEEVILDFLRQQHECFEVAYSKFKSDLELVAWP